MWLLQTQQIKQMKTNHLPQWDPGSVDLLAGQNQGSRVPAEGLTVPHIDSCLYQEWWGCKLWPRGLSKDIAPPNIQWTPPHHPDSAGGCYSQHDALASPDSLKDVTCAQRDLNFHHLREWEGISGGAVSSDVLSRPSVTLHGWNVACSGSFHTWWSGYWVDNRRWCCLPLPKLWPVFSSTLSTLHQDSCMYLCAILKELLDLKTLLECKNEEWKTGLKPVGKVSDSPCFCPIISITTSAQLSFLVKRKNISSEFAAIISFLPTIQNVLSFIKMGIMTIVLRYLVITYIV